MRPAILVVGVLLCCSGTGCATAPVPDLWYLNPWLVSDWREDQKFPGPTVDRQLEDLADLRSNARSMPPAEQAHWSNELRRLAMSDNPVLRSSVMRTLGLLRNDISAGLLRTAVNDPAAEVRVAAAEAWGNLGGEEARDVLASMVGSDTDIDVRLAATRQLGRFRDPVATQALSVALEDANPALQYRAMQSLKSTTGRDYGDNTLAWRDFLNGGQPQPQPQPSFVERIKRLF